MFDCCLDAEMHNLQSSERENFKRKDLILSYSLIRKYFKKWKLLSSFTRFANLPHLQWGLAAYNSKLVQK